MKAAGTIAAVLGGTCALSYVVSRFCVKSGLRKMMKRQGGDSVEDGEREIEEFVDAIHNFHSFTPEEQDFWFRKLFFRMSQFRGLLASSKHIACDTDFGQAVTHIVQLASKVVESDRATLFVMNKTGTHLKVFASMGTQDPKHRRMSGVQIPCDRNSIAGYVAVTGQPSIIADAYLDPRFSPEMDKKTNYRTKSVLCVPVRGPDGNVRAVLQAINKMGAGSVSCVSFSAPETGEFTNSDVVLLMHFADFAGGVLHKLWLHDESSRRQEKLEQLFEMMRSLTAEINPNKVIKEILATAASMIDCDRMTLFLVNRDRRELEIAQSEDAKGIRIPMGRGIAGQVAVTGEAIRTDNAQEHENFEPAVDWKTAYVTKSLLCMPVKDASGNVVAVLQAINKGESASFDDDDEALLGYVADGAGVALRKAQLINDAVKLRQSTQALLEVVSAVAEGRNLSELIGTVIQAATKLLTAETVNLFLVDEVKHELWLVGGNSSSSKIPMGEGILGFVAKNNIRINVPRVSEEPRYMALYDDLAGYIGSVCTGEGVEGPEGQVPLNNLLVVPVRGGRGTPQERSSASVIAVIAAVNKQGGSSFSTEDMDSLAAFSSEVAVALKRRSTEAAFVRLFSDGSKTEKETQLDSAVIAEYADETTTANLHTSMNTRSVSEDSQAEWPDYQVLEHHASQLRMKDALNKPPPFASWSLSVLDLDDAAILSYTKEIFCSFGLVERFNIRIDTLQAFILAVRRQYHNNPFHNFRHAFSVLHCTYMMMISTKAALCLRYIDILALFISAICHDLDHPGHNNAYEVSTVSELALTHNDDAVLERHHCSVCFKILTNPKSNILCNTSPDEFRSIRKTIVGAILHTDMAQHFVMVKKLNKIALAASFVPRPIPRSVSFHSPPSPQHGHLHSRSVSTFSSGQTVAPPTSAALKPDGKPFPATPQPMWHDSRGRRHSSPLAVDTTRLLVLKRSGSKPQEEEEEDGSEGESEGEPTGGSDPPTSAELPTLVLSDDALPPQGTVEVILRPPFDRESEQERRFLVEVFLHCADLSAQTLHPVLARPWGERCLDEFDNQARLEVKKGLTPAPFMMGLEDPVKRGQVQKSFMEHVLVPLWKVLAEIFPELADRVTILRKNLELCKEEVEALQRGEQPGMADVAEEEEEEEETVVVSKEEGEDAEEDGPPAALHPVLKKPYQP